jgi:hypothetical protein
MLKVYLAGKISKNDWRHKIAHLKAIGDGPVSQPVTCSFAT